MRRYEGYRLAGFPPGIHRGMPSPDVTVIITFGEPVALIHTEGRPPDRFDALASGLSSEPVIIAHTGFQHGIQLSLTPSGARALLGVPASALGSWAVDLEDVLGVDYRELSDGLDAAPTWPERFAILDRVLARRLVMSGDVEIESRLSHAWRMLVSEPGHPVRAVADELGWSRRHLTGRFVAEFGLAPKEVARVARFHRSRTLLRTAGPHRLADVAALCGYYDQAHMARDWRDLAGVPPSRWLAEEVFPIVQDD
ncbi:transcriptional regulator [Rhodococcus coprophilus]|uniref:Transcriptional regulator n=2 Tax=Rhodococcus coprophilus TaxID=38310 RepID=A0A2X4X0Y9_9NOCA|nr:transcriptional regulator [Rhodococcus coprophilus]